MAHDPPVAGVSHVPEKLSQGASATGRSWWKMTSVRVPGDEGLIKHHTHRPHGARAPLSQRHTISDQPAQMPLPIDFADPLRALPERDGA